MRRTAGLIVLMLLLGACGTAFGAENATGSTAAPPPIGNPPEPDEHILNATEKLGDLPFRLPAPPLDEEEFDPSALYRDICQKALGAVSCKYYRDFNFIGRKDNALRFNAFYASKASDFYCFAEYHSVVLASPAWGKIRVTVPYTIDNEGRCVSAEVGMSFCSQRVTIQSCEKKKQFP
ncbi:MAG: hypothetical protein ACNI3A_09620 [Desulfovibrio sp.]|uniref:hypothetical protein n=1 Tax=Desulfovibrio sp. 7SRBS1 TaxID=3378064 RepID=UPI003B3E1BCE